jgi:hypothetical protein
MAVDSSSGRAFLPTSVDKEFTVLVVGP